MSSERPALAGSASLTAAVLTFRRPEDIAALVPLLLTEAASTRSRGVDAEVLVVDNDPNGSARVVVADAVDRWRRCEDGDEQTPLRYVIEPRPGIAAARNRVLDECSARARVAFLDDDERPRPGWLPRLAETADTHDAAAVAGRTITVFPDGTDRWIVDGGFLDRRHRDGLRTGDLIDAAATNNLLLDLRAVRSFGVRFDERFAESGGEDTLFTRTLVSHGVRFVWCDEAVVDDHPAADRMTRGWMLRRVFSHGVTDVRVGVALGETRRARRRVRLRALPAGLARIAAGVVLLAAGFARRDVRAQAHGAQRVARGAGMLAGVAGHVHREYRRPS